ncbi:hypothetical protein ABKV19_011549 [Rosa sericea]
MEYLGLGFGTVKPEEPHRKTRFGSVRFYNRNFASSICVGRLRFGVWDLVDDPSSICVGHGSLLCRWLSKSQNPRTSRATTID